MATTGSDILSTDINTLQNNTVEVLGNGSGSYGYGQNTESSPILSGQTILKDHFDRIRFDLTSIFVHQTGVVPSAQLALTTTPIKAGAGDPINQYASLANTARNNRFDVAPSQLTITSIGTKTYTGSWGTQAEAIINLSFATADEARFFFNTGSKVRVTASRTGGTVTSQNNAWTNILDNAGEIVFGANTSPTVNYYTLTNSYQTFYLLSTSTPYSANNINLAAKCNVANNATGTATSVDIRIRLSDDYVDLGPPAPGDVVDGTLEIVAEELKASGVLQPSLDPFTVTSPTFTFSNITAT